MRYRVHKRKITLLDVIQRIKIGCVFYYSSKMIGSYWINEERKQMKQKVTNRETNVVMMTNWEQ